MSMARLVGPLRHLLVLSLTVLAVGLGGCSLPGAAASTPTPLATPSPTVAAPSLAPTVAASASALPSAAPATATSAPSASVPPSVAPTVAATPTVRPATPTSAATPATPLPSAAATPAGGTQTLRDATGACELTVPSAYAPAATPGTVASADGKVLVALQALPIGPTDTLDDLTLPFVGAFIPTVSGYEQVAVIRLADSLRIDFRGGLPEPGTGTLYFKQFDATLCAVTIFIANDAGIAGDALIETLLATLRPKGVG